MLPHCCHCTALHCRSVHCTARQSRCTVRKLPTQFASDESVRKNCQSLLWSAIAVSELEVSSGCSSSSSPRLTGTVKPNSSPSRRAFTRVGDSRQCGDSRPSRSRPCKGPFTALHCTAMHCTALMPHTVRALQPKALQPLNAGQHVDGGQREGRRGHHTQAHPSTLCSRQKGLSQQKGWSRQPSHSPGAQSPWKVPPRLPAPAARLPGSPTSCFQTGMTRCHCTALH
jgi:hypothetical protein